MKRLALALATAATVGFAAPAFAHDATPPARIHVAQADVKVKVRTTPHGRTVKKVIVRRPTTTVRHVRHVGRHKVVIVKKRPHRRVVVKRTIIHR